METQNGGRRRTRAAVSSTRGESARSATAGPPSEGAGASHDLGLGERIRALRKRRRLPLSEVAAITGRSIGYLSQIERGLSSPTVRELAQLAGALGVDFLELLAEPSGARPGAPVRRRADETLIPFRGQGVIKRVLAPPNEGSISFYVMHIAVGGTSGDEPYTHDGEEAGYVLRGEVSLTIDGRNFLLRPGDSFRFMSHRPHQFSNAGRREAEVLWVNAGGGRVGG